MVFNNGVGRFYSTIDEIQPPMNTTGHYFLEQGMVYAPNIALWRYIASPPTSFYASFISGCQRLPNGNTLICDGPHGHFFEVTPEMDIVWEYTNPYPSWLYNDVFKIQYIPPEQSIPKIPDLDCGGGFE